MLAQPSSEKVAHAAAIGFGQTRQTVVSPVSAGAVCSGVRSRGNTLRQDCPPLARTSEPSISVAVTWPFQRVYAQLGLGEQAIADAVARYKLPVEKFADPSTRLPLKQVIADLRHYDRRLGRTDIGLLAAQATLPGDFGAVELAARACATVGEALAVLADGYALLCEGVHLSIEVRGDCVIERLWADPQLVLPPASVEFPLLSMMRLGQSYAGRMLYPDRVRFMHARVPHAAACERAFGCMIEFSSFENALEWPRAILDLPMQTANLGLGQALRARVETLVAATPNRDDVVAHVERVIAQHVQSGVPSFQSVAGTLGMSGRTLHRKLKTAGRTYREICHATRIRLALQHLEQTRSSIKEIAHALGFGDVQAFHKAFKRVTGTTPQQHRELHGGGATPAASTAPGASPRTRKRT